VAASQGFWRLFCVILLLGRLLNFVRNLNEFMIFVFY
jgi:hypothetical protein